MFGGFASFFAVDQSILYRAGLTNHLRHMEHPDFLVLMQELYVGLLNSVEGLQEQGRVIIDILDSLNS